MRPRWGPQLCIRSVEALAHPVNDLMELARNDRVFGYAADIPRDYSCSFGGRFGLYGLITVKSPAVGWRH